jgi:hypothetical protein
MKYVSVTGILKHHDSTLLVKLQTKWLAVKIMATIFVIHKEFC